MRALVLFASDVVEELCSIALNIVYALRPAISRLGCVMQVQSGWAALQNSIYAGSAHI